MSQRVDCGMYEFRKERRERLSRVQSMEHVMYPLIDRSKHRLVQSTMIKIVHYLSQSWAVCQSMWHWRFSGPYECLLMVTRLTLVLFGRSHSDRER